MGQEIERARVLLAALARDGVLVGERADAAYEAWVAHAGGDEPFARFLIRERRADAGRVRATLRIMAVQGMPHPERFTLERFEDLLMGQLGIDAGIVSPKLLQTVRAVQDKKAEEGKLRRLDELLPRAGFDPVQLRILREHLAERVLVCPGCLARFPRRDAGSVEHDCPRCGDRIASGPAKESELGLLPEPAKRQLLSTSGENSGVFETLTVAARERRAAPPQVRDRSAPTAGVVAAAVASVALVGGLAVWALSDPARPGARKLPPRVVDAPAVVDAPGQPPSPSPAPATPPAAERPPTYAEARDLDRRWAAEGKWVELIDVWRRVQPGPGEAPADVHAARSDRIAQLERRAAHAAEARRALDAAQAEPGDAARERALARAIADAPLDAAPYAQGARELAARRAARRAAEQAEGQRRLAAAREALVQVDPWAARLEQARRAPLAAVEVGGRAVSGVRVERLDAGGFALRLPDGEVRAFTWRDDPPLGLLVMQRGARDGVAEDRLEVLRRALAARDALAARAALEALGLAGALDPGAVLAAAPVSACATALPGGRWRLRWSSRAVGHDLTTRGSLAVEDGALALAGEPCALTTPPVPVAGDGAVEAALHLEGPARAPFAGVDLDGPRGRRSYVIRWDAQAWRLEVDLGAGANVLREGTLPAQARSVRARVTQSEVVFLLDGVERASAPVSTRYETVAVRAGAGAGPALVSDLTLEGAVSSAWLAEADARLAAEVDARLDALSERLAGGGGAGEPPRLSAEDPQGLAGASSAAVERLDSARRALAAGDVDRAAELLDEVAREAPGLAPALFVRALVAALQGDLASAHRRLARALEADAGFAEARALLALVLARAGRREAALAAATKALEARPDLAHAYLAQARLAWAARPADAPADPEVTAELLRLARALAPDDPLVGAEVRALRRGSALDAGLPLRKVDGPHAVAAPAGAERPAAELLKTLALLSMRYERELRRGAAPAPLRAVLLPPGASPSDAAAAWDADLGLLLVRDGATGLGWDLAHAVARAVVAQAYGAPPPWVEVGLATALAAPASAEDPPGLKEVLAAAPSWDADAWRTLLAMGRGPLLGNTLARAKAWALVAYAQRHPPAWQVVQRILDRTAKGETAAWPDDAPVDLGSLDAQIAAGGRRR